MTCRNCSTAEAKAKLSELLDQVVQGGDVIIQRHGKPIARLVATSAKEVADDAQKIQSFMTQLKAFHKSVRRAHGAKGRTVELLRELRRES